MSGITKHVSRLTAALVLLAPFLPTASAQEPSFLIEPYAADLAGGAWFRIGPPAFQDIDGMPYLFSRTAYFDGVPMEPFPADCYCDEYDFCACTFDGTIPPRATPGIVDVSVLINDDGRMTWHEFPEAFTYVDAPIVEVLEPNNHSIGPDNIPVELFCSGTCSSNNVTMHFWEDLKKDPGRYWLLGNSCGTKARKGISPGINDIDMMGIH